MNVPKKFTFGPPLILVAILLLQNNVSGELVRDLSSFSESLVDPDSIWEKLSRWIPLDKEAFMRVPNIILNEGYPVEVHDVHTEDGYILEMQRIPHGREGPVPGKRIPVLFLHMVIFSGFVWVTNTKEQSAGYIFADNGYDVWIGEHRGSNYGLRHERLDSNETPFWNYTYDALGRYDVPALIDYVREKTGYDKIYVVAQHGATIQLMMALALKPEYNDKIELVVGLSPIITTKYCNSPMNLVYNFPYLEHIFEKLHPIVKGQLPTTAPVVKFFQRMLYFVPTDIMRKATILPFAKYDGRTTNFTRYAVFMSHFADTMGALVSSHMLQIMNRGIFAPFDYGTEKNMQVYGKVYPSEYPLENVRVPILATWGQNDMLVSKEEVNHLIRRIKNARVTEMLIQHPGWIHMDYMFGLNAKEYCYMPIIRKLKEHEENNKKKSSWF